MNHNNYFKNKKITLLGLGVLGRGVGDAEFLAKNGAILTITDLKTEKELNLSIKKLKKYKNIQYSLNGHKFKDFQNKDLIIKSAGVPKDSIYIKEAKKNKIPVHMSTALFAYFTKSTLIGITGTRGKSTVTHLINYIVCTAGFKSCLGGNIRGVSTLILLNKAKQGEYAILELDSWQLQGFKTLKLSPKIAIFTNLMPDHLNYYKGNMKKYFSDKSNIFKYQKNSDLFITSQKTLNILKKEYKAKINSKILISNIKEAKTYKTNLLGTHNQENIALAIKTAKALNIKDSIIKKAIANFPGVPGRLELISKKNDIDYYNDTTSTMPNAAIAAINTFNDKKITLIAGGNDKKLEYKKLSKIISKKIGLLILLPGAASEKIIKSLSKSYKYILVKNIKEAVRIASKLTEKGSIVLFSPGATSFGLFKNEFDRGEHFLNEVKKL